LKDFLKIWEMLHPKNIQSSVKITLEIMSQIIADGRQTKNRLITKGITDFSSLMEYQKAPKIGQI